MYASLQIDYTHLLNLYVNDISLCMSQFSAQKFRFLKFIISLSCMK